MNYDTHIGNVITKISEFKTDPKVICNIFPRSSLLKRDGSEDDYIDALIKRVGVERPEHVYESSFSTLKDTIRNILTDRSWFDLNGNVTAPEQHAAHIAKNFLILFQAPAKYYGAHMASWVVCINKTHVGIVCNSER